MKKRSLENILKEKFSGQELPATPGAWEKIQGRLNKSGRKNTRYYLAAACIAAIAIVLFILLMMNPPVSPTAPTALVKKSDEKIVLRNKENKRSVSEEEHSLPKTVAVVKEKNVHKPIKQNLFVSVSANNKQEKYLPDSSLVSLNTFSKVEMQFGPDGSRNLKMEGEAYFKVKNIHNIPFRIEAGNSVIEVIGTAFNVRVYSLDSVEVLVDEGKVRFRNKDNVQHSVVLVAGEKGVLGHGSAQKVNGFSKNELAWRTGEIEFKKTKMSEAIHVLEDYFKTKIRVSDQGVLNCHVTAKFRQPRLDKVLDLFASLIQIQYEKKDQEYVLTGKGCD